MHDLNGALFPLASYKTDHMGRCQIHLNRHIIKCIVFLFDHSGLFHQVVICHAEPLFGCINGNLERKAAQAQPVRQKILMPSVSAPQSRVSPVIFHTGFCVRIQLQKILPCFFILFFYQLHLADQIAAVCVKTLLFFFHRDLLFIPDVHQCPKHSQHSRSYRSNNARIHKSSGISPAAGTHIHGQHGSQQHGNHHGKRRAYDHQKRLPVHNLGAGRRVNDNLLLVQRSHVSRCAVEIILPSNPPAGIHSLLGLGSDIVKGKNLVVKAELMIHRSNGQPSV